MAKELEQHRYAEGWNAQVLVAQDPHHPPTPNHLRGSCRSWQWGLYVGTRMELNRIECNAEGRKAVGGSGPVSNSPTSRPPIKLRIAVPGSSCSGDFPEPMIRVDIKARRTIRSNLLLQTRPAIYVLACFQSAITISIVANRKARNPSSSRSFR